MAEVAAPLSLRAYAKHRGCTHGAVRKAIATGRLAESVVEVDGQPAISDAELADLEWEENTTRAPAAQFSLVAEQARERHWKANLAELEYKERAGELVSKAAARAGAVEKFAAVKTKLLALPSRIRQRLPRLTAAEVQLIDDLVRQALEDLADGG